MKKEILNADLKPNESLQQITDKFIVLMQSALPELRTEEDLRITTEKILEPILRSIGIETKPRYERLHQEAKTVYRGRPDAVHGKVIIEYEEPNSFSFKRKVHVAYEQLVGYIMAESYEKESHSVSPMSGFVGIGFDGGSIFFVRYQGVKDTHDKTIDKRAFVCYGPYPLNQESAQTFLMYLRSLSRLPLKAEYLVDKFGPKSKLAKDMVSGFVDALENWGNERVQVLFNEWKRLFGIVYGEHFTNQQLSETESLSRLYSVGNETDFQGLLFSIHTYFALLMKLIAAELISLRESAFSTSFSYELAHVTDEELKAKLSDIEDGGTYARRGIRNFLEGDFFSWYIDAFSPRIQEAIKEIARALSEFEPATSTINPEFTRDLLKKLYQGLIPQEVRHKLGEYYTPDWLAELVLNEVGYKGDTSKRLLDPACGSGTFLVLAIQKAKDYSLKQRKHKATIAREILENIFGFDLNPLAVIAARTNYLFALGNLIDKLDSLEIPIYLADSVLWPEKAGQMQLYDSTETYTKIQTSIGYFHVPNVWIKERFLMRVAAPLVEELSKKGYSTSEAMKALEKEHLVPSSSNLAIQNFYEEIVKLEKEGKNGIWARLLKNSFVPTIAGKFDFVVGNPPWIRWGYLSKDYREATLPLWKEYGLFSLKGHAARLGGGEKDFSMLFTYVAADYYLKNDGKLGFLVTQEVFKSKGAGEGFRRFKLGQKTPLCVLKAHDLVSVKPFESAANKTAVIILKKGHETSYPLPYTVWERKTGIGKIPTDITLKEALAYLQKKKLMAKPIGKYESSWQTINKHHKASAIMGNNFYKARIGARIEPYGVFWLELKQVLSDGSLLVSNLADMGKTKVPKIEERIESDLVFPLVRGADINRWNAVPKLYGIVTQDISTRAGHLEEKVKSKWPRTYSYLLRFKQILLERAAYKKYYADEGGPFYSQYNIADYTFSRYKVVWKRMATDIIAAVISQWKTPLGYKIIIPTDTTSIFSTNSEDEAHYLCAIINSSIVREFIKSYSSAGRGFGTPSVMEHIGIPQFDPGNTMHIKLSDISKILHKSKNKTNEVTKLERELNILVNKLFNN